MALEFHPPLPSGHRRHASGSSRWNPRQSCQPHTQYGDTGVRGHWQRSTLSVESPIAKYLSTLDFQVGIPPKGWRYSRYSQKNLHFSKKKMESFFGEFWGGKGVCQKIFLNCCWDACLQLLPRRKKCITSMFWREFCGLVGTGGVSAGWSLKTSQGSIHNLYTLIHHDKCSMKIP